MYFKSLKSHIQNSTGTGFLNHSICQHLCVVEYLVTLSVDYIVSPVGGDK